MAGGRSHELDAWVLATAPRATAYARSLLHDAHAADDVVQDCYCRLLAKADVYDLPRDGVKLLMRAVTNACINLRTRRRPSFRRGGGEGDEQAEDPADAAARPADEHAAGKELAAAVAAALQRLPLPQRAAVELKSLGHSQQDIADALGVTVTNAGVLVHRARQALAQYLSPFLDGDGEPR